MVWPEPSNVLFDLGLDRLGKKAYNFGVSLGQAWFRSKRRMNPTLRHLIDYKRIQDFFFFFFERIQPTT